MAWFASTLGISAILAARLLTGTVGLIAIAIMYFSYYRDWQCRIRKRLEENFDADITPRLRDWADEVINEVNTKQLTKKWKFL